MARRARAATVLAALVIGASVVSVSPPAGARSCRTVPSSPPTGFEAWVELTRCYGHPLQVTDRTDVDIPARATVYITAGDATIDSAAVDRLVANARGGGRVVVVGAPPGWTAALGVPVPPVGAAGAREWQRVGEHAVTRGVASVTSAGHAAYANAPDAALGSGTRAVLMTASSTGRGDVAFLADVSVFDNTHLALDDAAKLALNLAGPEGRPVVIISTAPAGGPAGGGLPAVEERSDGSGGSGGGSGGRDDEQTRIPKPPPEDENTGLSALPFGWKFAIAGAAVAALLYAIARAKRVGPPEHPDRPLPPRRSAFVDAVGASMQRAGDPAGAGDGLRTRARTRIRVLGGLAADAPDEELARAARSAALSDAEIAALSHPPRTDDDILATARAVAKLEGNPS